jgi:hypothetical protein
MTGLPKKDISFSIAEGSKVAKIATDSSAALTYDTAIDISIVSVDATLEYFNAELRADGEIKDQYTEFEKVVGTFTLSEIDMDTLAMLQGESIGDTGTGVNQVISMDIGGNLYPNYFGFGFKSKYSPTGAVKEKHYIFNKCKITGINMGGGDREYNSPTISFEGIRTTKTKKAGQMKFVAKATDISFA